MLHSKKIASLSLACALVFGNMTSCQQQLPQDNSEFAPGGEVSQVIPQENTGESPASGTKQTCPLFFKSENLCAELKWIYLPSAREPKGELLLTFLSGSGPEWKTPKSPTQKPFVKLWMKMANGMEHGSDPIELKSEGPGRYRARGVNFRMAGSWQVLIQLRDLLGQKILDRAPLLHVQIR